LREAECVFCTSIMNLTEVFRCAYCSANAVSSRDGLDTETGTESLLSHRRERERERARRRARETEREYYRPGRDGSQKCNYPVTFLAFLLFNVSDPTLNFLLKKQLGQTADIYERRPCGVTWCVLNLLLEPKKHRDSISRKSE